MGERPAGIFERFSQPRLGLPQVSHRDTLLTSAYNATVVTRGQLRFIPDTFKQPYLYVWVDNQDLAYAADGASRMGILINDLLSYSRIGSEGKNFKPADCDLVLSETLANLRTAIEETSGTVTNDPLPTVMADDSQLGQVFQNLIGNALKYRSEEPPRVHVAARQSTGIGNFRSGITASA